MVVAGVTGVLGFFGVEFLGVWSQHEDGHAHVAVVERLDEISGKLDKKPDQENIEDLVRVTVSGELQKYVTPALAAILGDRTAFDALVSAEDGSESTSGP